MWVLRCLEDSRLDYVHDSANQYAWKVVTNVKNETEDFERVFAVHIGGYQTPYMNSAYDESGLVVVDENPPCPNEEVAADDLKAVLGHIEHTQHTFQCFAVRHTRHNHDRATLWSHSNELGGEHRVTYDVWSKDTCFQFLHKG